METVYGMNLRGGKDLALKGTNSFKFKVPGS